MVQPSRVADSTSAESVRGADSSSGGAAPAAIVAKSLVHGMADAAVLLDKDLIPICYNRSFIEATGLRPRRLDAELSRRRAIFELLGNTEKSDEQHARESLATNAPTHLGEMEVVNASGDRFVMMQSFLPISDKGAAVAVIAVFRDQSDEARVHTRYKELLRLEQARAEELEDRVAERTKQLSAALEEVTRLSTHDPLTKLFNRRAFDEKARYAWADAQSAGVELAILLCDLDHFKRVNDEYGHQAGDKVLVATAAALHASLRPDDVVARFGGEEFVILIKSAPRQTVLKIANRCSDAVRSLPIPDLVPGAKRRQSISIGVAIYTSSTPSLDQLIADADAALYEAKRAGRDRVVVSGETVEQREITEDDPRPRLLFVDPDEARAARYIERLSSHYAVVSAGTGVDALRFCARQPFDIIVSEEDVGTESGVSFLRKSFAFAPFSARVLILGSADAFLAIRATNVGRVDHLLLREDGESHLLEALEHARLKLDLVGQQRLGTEREESLIDTAKLEGLQEIMRAGRLRFAYQPIVHAGSHEFYGFEALARPEASGFCTPNSNPIAMLEVAERMGAQWELGRIGRKSIAAEIEQLSNDLVIFINLHPTELANEQMLEERGMIKQAKRVVLEITERAAIRDASRYSDQIQRLRELGFRLAVDDLGAGYAGLNSVAQLRPDFIKIDMALTRQIDRWQIKQRLVGSVVHFARQEGIEIVAEGIETEDESKAVEDLGCGLLQGFLHGRPKPLSTWRAHAD